jgi:hypothetical protein
MLSFQDICYVVTVKHGKNAGEKEILHSISGCFASGHLSALMGPSGSGKTSTVRELAYLKSCNRLHAAHSWHFSAPLHCMGCMRYARSGHVSSILSAFQLSCITTPPAAWYRRVAPDCHQSLMTWPNSVLVITCCEGECASVPVPAWYPGIFIVFHSMIFNWRTQLFLTFIR